MFPIIKGFFPSILSGRFDLEETLDGEEVIPGLPKSKAMLFSGDNTPNWLLQFDVELIELSKRAEEKFGTPHWKHSHETL